MSTAVLEPAIRPSVVHAPPRVVTAAEYLAFDSAAARRNEFIEGEIVEMAGASRVHVLIAGNIVQELKNQTVGRDCDIFFSDTRVRATAYYYPDVGVVCGEYLVDNLYPDTLTNPAVLIEVLSDSTEHVGRGIKLRHYRRLPSLRVYLLVTQDYPLVERYERDDEGGDWRLIETEGLTGTVELAAIGCRLPMEAIYRRVSFPDPAPEDAAESAAPNQLP
ncbi:MAG: Uma2 family endonuclease [Akkermansiaceae bacterium]|nr:Uma2 family endonuclease [Armatimonadota bacterium]